jgi:hypothetical protein
MPMSLPGAFMPELVRYPISAIAEDVHQPARKNEKLTRRERRLYVALTLVLSLNLSVICGAATFFGLLFGP